MQISSGTSQGKEWSYTRCNSRVKQDLDLTSQFPYQFCLYWTSALLLGKTLLCLAYLWMQRSSDRPHVAASPTRDAQEQEEEESCSSVSLPYLRCRADSLPCFSASSQEQRVQLRNCISLGGLQQWSPYQPCILWERWDIQTITPWGMQRWGEAGMHFCKPSHFTELQFSR